jgi:hypothetical protein
LLLLLLLSLDALETRMLARMSRWRIVLGSMALLGCGA